MHEMGSLIAQFSNAVPWNFPFNVKARNVEEAMSREEMVRNADLLVIISPRRQNQFDFLRTCL